VPVDWIVLIYFAAGLLIIVEPGAMESQTSAATSRGKAPASPRAVVAALVCLLVIGSGPLIADAAVQAHFASDGNAQESVDSRARVALLSAGYGARQVDSYMRSDKSIRLWGRAFYPRWLSYRAIAKGTEGGLEGVNFPGLQFWLLGPRGVRRAVYLFTTTEVQLANARDVIVLGCRERGVPYIEALAIVDLESGASPILRSNLDDLSCRLTQPVCDQNANCR
jgi:hypothetical protein